MNISAQNWLTNVTQAIQTVVPVLENVALHEPRFRGNEKKYVQECIDTGWVSSVGKYVDLFEEKLAAYAGVKRAIAVVNGTAALHMSLLLADVRANDEVIVPALTFIATTNAVAYCNAVPHFVDSEEQTLGINPRALDAYLTKIAVMRDGQCVNGQTGRRIAAVVPMHTFGHPVDLDNLAAVCEKFNLVLIEDAAESIGSFYKGKHTGQWGKVSALSFNGNKTMTTGGGGAILTNDEALGSLAKHLTTQAKVSHKWEFRHDAIGYNYRMPNINAALGCAQLEQLPQFIAAKRNLAKKYQAAFQDVPGLRFFVEPSFGCSNYWLNAILLTEENAQYRDDLLARLNAAKIMVRPVWNLMYTMPMYQECPRMECEVAESIGRRLINLPSSVKLGLEK